MLRQDAKPIEALTVADIEKHPVWQYANDDISSETIVLPFNDLPARSLAGMIIGTQVTLANGSVVWALIANIDTENPVSTEHFLTLSVESNAKWYIGPLP